MTKHAAQKLLPGDQVSVPISPRRVGIIRRGLIVGRACDGFTVRWEDNVSNPSAFRFVNASHYRNLTLIARR